MNQLEGFRRLFTVIKTGYRHENYERVCKLAETYEAFSTGDDLNDYLRKFASRETDEAFTERKKITIEICSSIVSNLTHIYYRVPRSNGVKLNWKIDDTGKRDIFETALTGFYRDGFNAWMDQKIKDQIELDPNAWIVIEFVPSDPTKQLGQSVYQPYPYIVDSESAIDYKYNNAILEYLIDLKEVSTKNKEGVKKEVERYTIYTKEGAVIVAELPDNYKYQEIDFSNAEVFPEHFNIGTKSYEVIVPLAYNLPYVPARCVGYLADKSTKGETYVNMYDSVVPFLEKMLKVNSELDITMCKHAHMQKIQYVRKCTNTGCSACDDGVYRVDDHICPICKGRGYMDVTTGGLEYIYFPLPETKDEMIDLNNVVNYIGVPIEVATFQSEYLDKMIEMCKKVMYNSDIFSKEQISDTATAKVLEMENVYDTLYPYALNYAKLYEFCLKTSSYILEVDKETVITSAVNKDFKLMSKADLIAMLQSASQAGANESVISAINDEITYSFYGEGDEYKRRKLIEKLLPFQNKTREQQTLILSQLPKDNPYYIGYVFGNEIINELSQTITGFYDLNFEKQKQLFDARVLELIPMFEIKPNNPYNPSIGG